MKLTTVRHPPVHNTSLDLQVSQRIICSHFAAKCLIWNDVCKESRERLEGEAIPLYYFS